MIELRPSAAGKWVNCTQSAIDELGKPEGDTSNADEGTIAHWLAASRLTTEAAEDGHPKVGSFYRVAADGTIELATAEDEDAIEVTQDMWNYVDEYVNAIKRTAEPENVHVEEAFPVFELLGYPGAKGTPDAVITRDDGIEVHDLKYGYNPVHAKDNLQLASYAFGVINTLYYDTVDDDFKITLNIHQPRLKRVDVAEYTIATIRPLWELIRQRAHVIQHGEHTEYNPGEHCHKHYCKARATCTALAKHVLSGIPDMEGLENADIAEKLSKVEAIRKWCDAIEAEAYTLAVDQRQHIPGYKVVEGRGGARKWRDALEAEELFKRLRLKNDIVYKYSLVSPTQAEALQKEGKIGPKQWEKIKDLIAREPGKLQLVPESDKRQAVVLEDPVDDMPDLDDDDFSDLI